MSRCPVIFPEGVPEAAQIPISAETAAFLGMNPSSNPTVDEALIAAVLSAGNYCRVNVTVTVGGKAAKAGILVNGLRTLTGGTCYTDSSGKVTGLTSSTNTSVRTGDYVDLPSVSKSVSTPAQGTVNVTLALAAPVSNTVRTFTGTTSVMFSPYVTRVDVCCVGGGGGGGRADVSAGSGNPDLSAAGGGGGGGYLTNKSNVAFEVNKSYQVVVGNGGVSGSYTGTGDGGVGGASSFLGVTAAGGNGGGFAGNSGTSAPAYGLGGVGNGNGNGGASTGAYILDLTAMGKAGGGGGSGNGGSGGTPFGGDGANATTDASAGKQPGGGGGGAYKRYAYNPVAVTVDIDRPAAAGGRGAVYCKYEVRL